MLLVRGWASTSAIDAEDHSFAPEAIRWPQFNVGGSLISPPIELLYHHRGAPVGKIITLARRATKDGSLGLWIEASVSPEYTYLPFSGFSVRTKIERYEIKHRDVGPYALVKSAFLLEVSLVREPCNPDCLVTEREEFCEVTPYTIEAINKLRSLQQLIEKLQRANK
ncbi:hypothetical protein [Mesorhizobium kowhaii]|uniref:hypothetical protein n=1 Tax=Mesorhizobium kowhaii TaxID=1300272 RepID=UPI0011B548ED|nr:hypothetical protein [Mesorhizobium kowhaii]